MVRVIVKVLFLLCKVDMFRLDETCADWFAFTDPGHKPRATHHRAMIKTNCIEKGSTVTNNTTLSLTGKSL